MNDELPLLITLHPADVPLYLQQSHFYLGLTDNDAFSVPTFCFSPSAKVSNFEELYRLLCTLRYWGVEEAPEELISYILSYPKPSPVQILAEFADYLPYTGHLKAILDRPGQSPLFVAYWTGNLHIVHHLEALGYECSRINLCSTASANNSLDCLKHARQKGAAWNVTMCEAAVRRGHFECLQYAVENGCPWVVSSACTQPGPVLQTSRFELQQFKAGYGLCSRQDGCCGRFYDRHLQCLQYAHEHGYYWGTVILIAAADSGHLPCLQYARRTGCPWSRDVTNACAAGGHLACLQYCVENGCPIDASTALVYTALGGHIHCVPYLLELGASWCASVTTAAAEGGHMDFLIYTLQHHCALSARAMTEAAIRRDLKTLQFLQERGCPSIADAYRQAARRGYWECCDYLRRQACPLPWGVLRDASLRTMGSVMCPEDAYWFVIGDL